MRQTRGRETEGYRSNRGSQSADNFTSLEAYPLSGARILPSGNQLASGDGSRGDAAPASPSIRANLSVGRRRTPKGRFKRVRNLMGKYPFIALMKELLRETDPWYMESSRAERRRKFRRIHDILQELRQQGKISTTSPKKLSEHDIVQFIGWCKEHLDAETARKYLRYLDEILQFAGNNALRTVKLKHRNFPRGTQKSIQTIPNDVFDRLVFGNWSLENEWWNAVGHGALALYAFTGMRSSEVRLAKLDDLNLERMTIRVSSPKGHHRWASGEEEAPIMPAALPILREYLDRRARFLRERGLEPDRVEPLFPYKDKRGNIGFWYHQRWNVLKRSIELASGTRFRWKDLRPTFAQRSIDLGIPVEIVSKALRHSSTQTTEQYYARIRAESAFSRLRQVWGAAVGDNLQIAN